MERVCVGVCASHTHTVSHNDNNYITRGVHTYLHKLEYATCCRAHDSHEQCAEICARR